MDAAIERCLKVEARSEELGSPYSAPVGAAIGETGVTAPLVTPPETTGTAVPGRVAATAVVPAGTGVPGFTGVVGGVGVVGVGGLGLFNPGN